MPTRTLQETLRERISSGEAKQLRFWEDEASSKSSSGSSSGSYDGTIVKLAETISATEYLPSKPIQYLPLTNHPSQTAWNACRKHAVQILEDVGINWTSLLIQLERDSSNRIRPIMLIMVTDASRHELWRDTTILLDKMLYVRDIRDLAIEFSVPEGPDNFCFPIEPAHPLVALWPQKLRLPVVMILEQSTPWQTMSVFRYGLSNSSATPTVLITVPDIKSQDYSALEHVLNNELSRLHASSLRVKIVQGELNGRINAELPTGGLSLQTYAKLANMGCSIGTDDRGSGTLGGYVRISKGDGKTRICALTNFHVVRHFVPEWKAEFDNKGVKIFQYPPLYSKVWSPSNRDHEIEIENLKRSTTDAQSAVDGASMTKTKIDAEMATKAVVARYEALVARRDMHARRLNLCQTIGSREREFGEVIAASGYRKRGRHRLDWALISANATRLGANNFPEPSDLPAGFNLRGETKAKTINEDTDYTGGIFFKIGRTTGLTYGKYNSIHIDVKMPLPDNDQTESKRQERQNKRDATSLQSLTVKEREAIYKEPFYQYTEEHAIVSIHTDKERVFSKAGDSGSWVFDSIGMLVGMIFGDNGNGVAYFTPIALILEDIEAMTDCTVELV